MFGNRCAAYWVFVAMVVIFASSVTSNYCSINNCAPNTHTLCKFKSPSPSSNCDAVISTSLTADEKRALVNRHNELRRKVESGNETRGNPGPQPKAKYMKTITWDDELEEIAKRWIIQCQGAIDECRNVDRFSVGQNFAGMSTTGNGNSPVEKMVDIWYNGVSKFNRNSIKPFKFTKDTGSYTQLVWADTYKIGCGAIRFKKNSTTTTNLVCNYGPSGNFNGGEMYEIA